MSGQQFSNYEIKNHVVIRTENSLYLAHDITTDSPIFLLIIDSTVDQEPDLAHRFQQRMETVSQLEYATIASIQEIGVTPTQQPYAVLEYIPGALLTEKLANWNKAEDSRPVTESLHLVQQIADALAIAESADLIHYDLRPESILIREDGTPVIVDLGMPLISIPPAARSDQQETDRLDYSSPEQLQGKPLSIQSNIYSVGIILYELLAGHPPEVPISSWDIFDRSFTSTPKETPLEEIRADLSSETYQLVKDCLWRQEWNRFETIAALSAAIEQAIIAEQTPRKATSILSLQRRWLFAAMLLILLVSLIMGFTLLRGRGQTNTVLPETAVPTQNIPSPSPMTELTATPDQPATPTEAAPPTQLPATTIDLLAPPSGSEFSDNDIITFDWFWPVPLDANQQFSVYLISEDDTIHLGTVTDPIIGAQYRLQIDDGLILDSGTYNWQINLEEAESGESVVESELQLITIIVNTPTPTPSPTASATIVTPVTATGTPTPQCQPTPPDWWVSYIVQPGDRLFTLAVQTGITPERVSEVNCLSGSILSIGQKLWLPSFPFTPTPTITQTPIPDSGPPPSPKPPPTRTPPPPPSFAHLIGD